MAINFKDWQKNLHEEQLDEAPTTKAKAPYRPGSIDPATGKTREAPKGTMAYDKAQRSKKDEVVVNNGETVKENETCGKKTFREFVESLDEVRGDEYGWEVKAPKEKPTPTSRKVAGKAYGGAAQHDDDEDEDDNDKSTSKEAQPKRGRGRPAGSKSGARTAGNGKQYGGLAIHSLNLPSKK